MFGVYKQFTYYAAYKKDQEQSGGADCGLFSIAFATALMLGEQPEAFFFNQKSMRKNLKKCFEKQTMQIFPGRGAKQETDPIKCTELIPVYCICRMPDLTDSTLIECTTCKEWYHTDSCVVVSKMDSVRKTKWRCDKCQSQKSTSCIS